ncbi:hypothetical protein M5K25_007193 [Dendrobium thyrsiflorum]|uniref:Cytochrome P450 n=1 Tax=Dendrobium thyrsiflorum TaxID=117978 RepID=A0ABD0VDL2_DENTH
MVIQEVLRLYPPGPVVSREALQDMKLGGIQLPKGINIFIPVPTMHQDLHIWGPDAYEFNPKRFEHGVMGACKIPQMYLPFGAGPRTCLGQNFAMVELKLVLALILQKFSFTLSPNYKHSPTLRLIVEPEHGVDLIVKKMEDSNTIPDIYTQQNEEVRIEDNVVEASDDACDDACDDGSVVIKKRRRMTSKVWGHFEMLANPTDGDTCKIARKEIYVI